MIQRYTIQIKQKSNHDLSKDLRYSLMTETYLPAKDIQVHRVDNTPSVDILEFIKLYNRFRIPCHVDKNHDGTFAIRLEPEYHYKDEKLDGYSDVFFNRKGKFLKQGFWE